MLKRFLNTQTAVKVFTLIAMCAVMRCNITFETSTRPNGDFYAVPSRAIKQGESVTLYWSINNVDTCTIDKDGRTFSSLNSLVVYPPVTTLYTLNCSSTSRGTFTQTVTVTVDNAVSYGWCYCVGCDTSRPTEWGYGYGYCANPTPNPFN